ncbi:hypothetical protein BU16DRAFT_524790 [Lophium mytilinum]|uniref:Uncharacterized protein n=1 Tax=Lophium mytilinum TaxID=390894 RepID=A0A6A6R5G4_9PEZI|nr:hypothetical protein BU16DRAFT_524790 [Lophium mytilinum]
MSPSILTFNVFANLHKIFSAPSSMSPSSMAFPTPTWAGFPGELKNKVYAELFCNDDECLHVQWDPRTLKPKLSAPIAVALMRTNRETYREVVSFLFGNNILHLDLPPHEAIKFLDSIPADAAGKVKSITVGPHFIMNNGWGFTNALAKKLVSMDLDTITVQLPRSFEPYERHVENLSEVLYGLTHGLMANRYKTLRLAYPGVWKKTADIELYYSIKMLRSLGSCREPFLKIIDDRIKDRTTRASAAQTNNVFDPAEAQRLELWREEAIGIARTLRLDFKAAFGEQCAGKDETVIELTSGKLDRCPATTNKRKFEAVGLSEQGRVLKAARRDCAKLAVKMGMVNPVTRAMAEMEI